MGHTPARTAVHICYESEVALLLTDPSPRITLLRRSLEADLNQQARRERASNGAACACGRVCHGGRGGAARRGGRACTRRPTLPLEPLLLRTRWSLTAPLVRLPNRPPSSRPDTCVAALVAPLSCARGPRSHGAPCPTC